MSTAVPEPFAEEQQSKEVSQNYWVLVWWRFRQNKLAMFGGFLIIAYYFVCTLTAEFWSPYLVDTTSDYLEAPPQRLQFRHEGRFQARPFVYGLTEEVDMTLRKRFFVVDESVRYPIHLFVRGEEYRLAGLIPSNIHLFGVDPEESPDGYVYLFGTDRLGRDLFTRIIYGGRLSLLIGLIGQVLTITFGATLGVISGWYGRLVDLVVQRITEFLSAFPDIPLFMALAAAIPPEWSPIAVYFMLTIILAFVRWGGLARQVRGLVLSLREREYVLAAQSFGSSDWRVMFRHLIPGATSHIIVISTLAIPGMILAETALSWLGLGLRPPLTSWGVLLYEVSGIRTIQFAPWMLITIPFIIGAIWGFNMLGDGLRDALDPYGGQ